MKINSSNAKGLLIKFVIKSVILTVISVLLFSVIFSFIVYKADLDLKYLEYLSFFVCAISAVITAYFSVKSFKNNGFVMGILSCLPLVLYSFINLLINGNNIIYFLIKLLIILLFGGIFGLLSTKKSKKFKVK
ncbi:MAG: TIGR04086 family membrane protein [Eubacterium sp.]|nr:TIGR04086 family membrane protein [Eubacterium sp.]